MPTLTEIGDIHQADLFIWNEDKYIMTNTHEHHKGTLCVRLVDGVVRYFQEDVEVTLWNVN